MGYSVSGDLGRIDLSADFGQPVPYSHGNVGLASAGRSSNGHSRRYS